MVAQQSIGEVITGTVEATNARGAGGVKINGQWFNVSKWGDAADNLPDRGEVVVLHLDKSNFIRSIERQGGAAEVVDTAPEARPLPAGPDRSRSIERQTALKAATELAVARIAAGGTCTSLEVLQVAEAFANWIAS